MAAERTVGPGAQCEFDDLQTAINNANDGDVLRLAGGLDHSGRSYQVFFAGPSITIRGGYADCSAGATASGRTDINVDGSSLPVFDIWFDGGGSARQINLENLLIRGSSGSSAAGVAVEGRIGQLQVNLRNVEIADNSRTGSVAARGAGLRVVTSAAAVGAGPMVTVDDDSLIINNQAEGDGGGVYCESSHANGDHVPLRIGNAVIAGNEAANGGGVAIAGCRNVELYTGGEIVLVIIIPVPSGGIINNIASNNGGGISVQNGGQVFVRGDSMGDFGDPTHAALLLGNSARSGGGGFVSGADSELNLVDAFAVGNSAEISGGAFRLISDGELTMGRAEGSGACAPVSSQAGVTRRPPCSVVEENSAGSGGAFSVTGGAQAAISRTIFRANEASNSGRGALVDIGNLSIDSGADSELSIASSLIVDHQGLLQSLRNNARVEMRGVTASNNSGGNFARLGPQTDRTAALDIRGMVIDHGASLLTLLGSGTTTAFAQCLVTNQPITEFTSTVATSQIDPQLRNPDGGDYRPSRRSPAIDSCIGSAFEAGLPDLNGAPRGQAWTGPDPVRPPSYYVDGLFDMGAYEASWPGDAVFADRFE
jgi:predicted outer membrane repeat protein